MGKTEEQMDHIRKQVVEMPELKETNPTHLIFIARRCHRIWLDAYTVCVWAHDRKHVFIYECKDEKEAKDLLGECAKASQNYRYRTPERWRKR